MIIKYLIFRFSGLQRWSWRRFFYYYYLFIYLFIYFWLLIIYLLLVALGLHCCLGAFSSCGKRGLLFIEVHRLLIAVASLVVE